MVNNVVRFTAAKYLGRSTNNVREIEYIPDDVGTRGYAYDAQVFKSGAPTREQ